MKKFFKKHKNIVLLVLVLILAGVFRFYRIDSIPPGLHYDERINLKNAQETLETGQFKVFYGDNFGREGLYIWLAALSFKFFGVHAWSLRLISALIGALTVLGLYLMAGELTNDKKAAFCSSFLLAVSFWHTNFSRIGYRAILVPFVLCFSFYFLFKAVRKKSTLNFILAGIFFGLGFYTYIAFRLAVLLLGLLLFLETWKYHKANRSLNRPLKKLWQNEKLRQWSLFLISILLIALPLAIYFFQTPEAFVSRSDNLSVFGRENPIKELCLSATKTLGMFNFYGDPNWRHNYSGSPMLSWPIGILFLLGLFLTIKELWVYFFHGAKKRFPELHFFLFSWLVVMLLPAVLTFEGMPHALRSIGVIPVVYIFAALGLFSLFEKISEKNKKAALIILILLLLYPALSNFHKYFYKWAQNPKVYSSFQ